MTANRGPQDPSVLYLQATHISSTISADTIDHIIHVKRSDNLIWMLYSGQHIHNRVIAYLQYMGFYGVLQCGFRTYDNHLITALVERWRRETHTFHFRCGEATVTLQDVSIIWGLRVDGEPVSGVDYSHSTRQWQNICLDLLGFEPAQVYFKGGHLSMTALHEHCIATHISDYSSEEDVQKYSRCVALMIIGGIMFPDYQGGSVRLMFLQLLRDINLVNSYSWGSAVLAFLYRQLCNATNIGKCIISGPLYILQIWAWSRIKLFNPDRLNLALVSPNIQPDGHTPIPPYGARWNSVFSYTHTPTHAVRIIRACFDQMNNDEFNWTVYRRNDIDVKTIVQSYDNKIWRCVCPLICFEIVEMHRPNRVMRQFKMRQSIPVPALDNDSLHNVTRIGHRNTDWKLYHMDAIRLWNRKFRLVADGVEHGRSRQIDDDYMPWFESVTVRVISPIIHGVGYRPLPYDPFVAGQHDIPQNFNFSTPSLDSQQSFGGSYGNVGLSDVLVSPQSSTGPSAPSIVVNTVESSAHVAPFDVFASHQSLAGPSTRQHLTPEHDTLQSFVDQGYQSFTDLLNVNLQHNVPDHTERNIFTPIPFPSFTGEHNIDDDYDTSASSEQNLGDEDVELGRGRRRRRPTKCGTGHHLHY